MTRSHLAEVRWRRRPGQNWRTGHALTIATDAVEIVDKRSGAVRTLDPARADVEYLEAGGYHPICEWQPPLPFQKVVTPCRAPAGRAGRGTA